MGSTLTGDLNAVTWTGTAVRIVDQTKLPGELTYLDLEEVDAVIDAVVRLAVRGAPALGAVGALGVAVALRQARRAGWDEQRLSAEVGRLREARPTAVNLAWGVDQVARRIAEGEAAVVARATALMADEEAANRAIGRHGADWILARTGRGRVRVLTHCNTGALAASSWGTALGIVRELHGRGALDLVYVNETRPLLQGARLTAFELQHLGIPYLIQADSAASSTIVGGKVDVAIIGADRIAANGDTANKIGSLGVALACRYADVPFVVAAPESTVDMATATGAAIKIELRADDEVLNWGGVRIAPAGSAAYNPAFDVTPAELVTALVTEAGVLAVSASQSPASVAQVKKVEAAAG